MPRQKPSGAPSGPLAERAPTPPAGLHRRDQPVCALHRCTLSVTGYCPAAEAYWYPKFRCDGCASWLWDNGYCPLCTPERGVFPGDYYEQTWADGRTYGHYVRRGRGPTPAPTAEQVAGYLAELRAIAPKIGRAIGQTPTREPGDERVEDVAESVPF